MRSFYPDFSSLLFGFSAVVGVLGDIESGWAVLELHTHGVELCLHFIDRLRSEVTDIHQICLGADDQLTDGVDPFALQAVVGTHCEIEILDRKREIGSERLILK